MTAVRAGRPALYRQVIDTLRRRVEDGTYAPGVRLPSEPILAAQLEVHRLTVRRAVEELAREGILQPRQGVGTFVAVRPSPLAVTVPLTREEFASSLRDQLEIRGRRYVDRLLHADVADSPRARHELGIPRAQLCRVESDLEVDGEVWVRSSAWGPNRLLHRATAVWRQTDGIYGVLLDGPAAPLRQVWRSFAAAAATADDARRLGIRPGSPVLIREGITAGADGKPVLFVQRRARADRVHYLLQYDD